MFNKLSESFESDRQRRNFYAYFFVIALVISGLFFFLMGNKMRSYSSEISVIFIPKSEKAALNAEQITTNLKIFPTKLSFYNKLLKNNSSIEDEFSGLSDAEREAMWNQTLNIKREGKSSIINISITGENQEESTKLSKAVVFTLLNTAGFYYDIKNDIDLRIIDGPIIHSGMNNIFGPLTLSLVLGILASIIIGYFSYIFSAYHSKKAKNISFRSVKETPKIIYETEKPYEIKKPEKGIGLEKIKAGTPSISTQERKYSAPENLPFVDEDYFRRMIKSNGLVLKERRTEKSIEDIEFAKSAVEKAMESKKETANLHREPTQEELKRRLNQLLRGDL